MQQLIQMGESHPHYKPKVECQIDRVLDLYDNYGFQKRGISKKTGMSISVVDKILRANGRID